MAQELTDEQIAKEAAFLKGLPRVNMGALLMPPIWGPAHGMWLTILFYPIWLLADNTIYAAVETPTGLSITLAVIVLATLVVATVVFAIVAQPRAAHRAEALGISRATYVRRERWWAAGSAAIAIAMVAWATYYNIAIRPTMGA